MVANAYPAMALAPQTAAYIANDSPLSWYYKGRQERQDNEQRNLLKEAGGLAAQGNTQGATSALFRGGDVNTATNLANWDTGRRTQALKLLLDGARRADTPERWDALVNSVERTFGPEMVGQYRDFNARPAAMTALEQAQLQLQQSQLAAQRQDLAFRQQMQPLQLQTQQLDLEQKRQLLPLQLLQTQNAVATAEQDRAMQRSLMGAALGGPTPAAAPPAVGQSPLGPVTPRPVQTLPLNDDTGAALMPQGATPPQAIPQTAAPAGPIIPQSVPQQQPAIAPPSGPQVRGWEGGEQPDFVGTPMARGQVAQPVPTAPAPASAPAAAQGGTNFSTIFANMTPQRRLAAAALIAKKDWSGFAKMLNEDPEATAAASARGKAMGTAVGEAQAQAITRGSAAADIAGSLQELASLPRRYGGNDGVFGYAIGPNRGDTDSSWYQNPIAPLSRAAGSVLTYGPISGPNSNAPPAEVRRAIQRSSIALASMLKDLVRKSGEGTLSDADQRRIDSLVGNLALAPDVGSYRRELQNIRSNIMSSFGIQLPEIDSGGQKAPSQEGVSEGTIIRNQQGQRLILRGGEWHPL